MKLAVVAANGRSGSVFVNEALRRGHSVKAGVYGQHSFSASENLEIVECDAQSKEQLRSLISGSDAVVSMIGHGKNSPAHVQTDAIKNIVEISKQLGVKRVISLTGTGVRFPGDKITLMDRLLNLSISIIDPKRVNDGIEHAKFLQTSQLDWTIIRVLKLTNGPAKSFSLTANGPTKVFTPRTEVALACLQVLEQGSYAGQAPIISKSLSE